MPTKTAGIRELKAKLSSYLTDVKRGGEVLVAERGRPIARIVPVGSPGEKGRAHARLLRLAQRGIIILPASCRPPQIPKVRKKVVGSPFSDAVLEGRR